MDVKSLKTSRPKVDPLRPFPAALAGRVDVVRVPAGKSERVTLPFAPGLHEVNVALEAGSSLVLGYGMHGKPEDFARLTFTVALERDSRFQFYQSVTGGARLETEALVSLQGSGAEASLSGAFHGRNEEHHGFHIVMQHAAPSTKGDVHLKGVYEGKSRGLFTALIRIEKGAQQTNSYFRDDVLLLDEGIAESIPTLEIEANDVRATHGSTTGRISEEQLFYLESRGLDREEARRLIVEGFLATVMTRVQETIDV